VTHPLVSPLVSPAVLFQLFMTSAPFLSSLSILQPDSRTFTAADIRAGIQVSVCQRRGKRHFQQEVINGVKHHDYYCSHLGAVI